MEDRYKCIVGRMQREEEGRKDGEGKGEGPRGKKQLKRWFDGWMAGWLEDGCNMTTWQLTWHHDNQAN